MIFVIKAHCGTEYRSIFKRYLSFLYCRHVISHHLLIIDIVIQRISERDFEIGQFFFLKKQLHIPFKNANVVPPLWMSSPNYEGALSICCLTLLHFSRINPSHYYLAVLCYTYRFSLSCPPFWYSDCGCR